MGIFQNLKKMAVAGLALVTGFFAAAASAAPVDFTSLTSSVDFSSVITAILLVAAALMGVYIAWKGAKMIISAVRGG